MITKTLTIPPELLDQAKRASGKRSAQAVVLYALEFLVSSKRPPVESLPASLQACKPASLQEGEREERAGNLNTFSNTQDAMKWLESVI